MSNTTQQGRVSFINHEKKYLSIEYEENGRKKTLKGLMEENGARGAGTSRIKKPHQFHIGDTVSFTAGMSDRGDRMLATNIQFLYNTALDVLIQKAKTENNFIGYLKVVDGRYFVKEINSYLFFPVRLSPWQLTPTEAGLNEAVTFELEHLDKKEKITASLFTQKFIPEYYSAERAYKKQEPVQAEVYKISPHGIYLRVFGDKITCRIPVTGSTIRVAEKIKVKIAYLSKWKIVVEPVL